MKFPKIKFQVKEEYSGLYLRDEEIIERFYLEDSK